jgi:cytoskeletal protein CcmA (bactofilin family)
MWKKEDTPDPVPTPRPEPVLGYERPAAPRAAGERATIGRSISISGQVSGDEDLLIQGRVDGSVNLKQHAVTVGPEGEIKADITARLITVEGRVEGNLGAQEQVILRGSAIVEGNITAPRVVLEDGARFRGGVDMGETPKRSAVVTGATPPTGAPDVARAAPANARGNDLEAGSNTVDEKSASAGVKDVASQAAVKISR